MACVHCTTSFSSEILFLYLPSFMWYYGGTKYYQQNIYILYIYIYTKNWQNQEINFNNIYNNIYAHKNYINRIYIYIYIYYTLPLVCKNIVWLANEKWIIFNTDAKYWKSTEALSQNWGECSRRI